MAGAGAHRNQTADQAPIIQIGQRELSSEGRRRIAAELAKSSRFASWEFEGRDWSPFDLLRRR